MLFFQGLCALGTFSAILLIFLVAPRENTMGDVQRIFYFHLSSAWIAFLSFFVGFVASIGFLSTRELRFDAVASSAIEVGVLFCSYVLFSGMLWAKPVWGIWWTWDARLTSTFVLWLIFLGYLVLRRIVSKPEVRASLSAVIAVIGFVDVPIVYMAIRWWRTQHPSPVIGGGEGSGLDPLMAKVLFLSFIAFLVLGGMLFWLKLKIEKFERKIEGELKWVI